MLHGGGLFLAFSQRGQSAAVSPLVSHAVTEYNYWVVTRDRRTEKEKKVDVLLKVSDLLSSCARSISVFIDGTAWRSRPSKIHGCRRDLVRQCLWKVWKHRGYLDLFSHFSRENVAEILQLSPTSKPSYILSRDRKGKKDRQVWRKKIEKYSLKYIYIYIYVRIWYTYSYIYYILYIILSWQLSDCGFCH